MSGSQHESSGSSGKGDAGKAGGKSAKSGKPKKKTTQEIVPIYARLPKGPHRIGAIGVARNQRIRIHGGMIEAVTTRGYQKTSVRLVIGLAGVSRRAFYEQFSGKEDCFLETFDLVVNRALQRLAHAYRTAGGGPQKRMRTALETLGGELEQSPKALRLVVSEAQTAGPEGLRRLHRAAAVCEGLLSGAFSDPRWAISDRPDALPLPVVRAILGGLRRTTRMRLRDEETEDLGALMKEMLKWSLVFKAPAAQGLRPRPCANPPFPEVLELELDACGGEPCRARLLRSAIEVGVREQKYEELTKLRIADDAGLPIESFMELFPGPEACYLEALDELGDELLQLVANPGLVSAEWPAAVCSAVERLLAYLASSPARLVTLAAKALEAGPATIANMDDLAYELATLLTEGSPRRPRTRIAVEGIAGALWYILHCEVIGGRGHRLPALSEYISYVILTPFLGPDAALAAIEQSRPAGSQTQEIPRAGASNGSTASNGAANGAIAGNGAAASHSLHTNTVPGAGGKIAATNGAAPPTEDAGEDYRRLADRRSAKCVNTTPTSTESTITTISGA